MKSKKKLRKLPFHPVSGIFQLMGINEVNTLAADIKANKQREAIWLHQDGSIIDGRNRHLACLKLGRKTRSKTHKGPDSGLVAFVLSLNLHRRQLDESGRAMAASRLATLADGQKKQGAQICAPSQDEAAELLNVSRRLVQSARKVANEGADELIEAVDAGEVAVSDAASVVEEPKRDQVKAVQSVKAGESKTVKGAMTKMRNEEIKAQRVDPPKGQYRCIVIDPPWVVQKIERECRPNQHDWDYPPMTEEELVEMDNFPETADEGCHLYLWVTHKMLPAGLRLAEEWGFKYQCLMTWVKNVGFTPFSWMYSTEHVLFCTKGGLKLEKLGMRLDFSAKVREHSRKPDEFYDLVRQASPGPRIDVFSREKREGFDQWGNEEDKFNE